MHPKTVEDISASWMNQVLHDAGVLHKATVRAVDVHPIGEGLGFLRGCS